MSQDRPRVSVIIPVFNAARYLAEAVDSVLRQTLPPLETIIIDDGSKDGTAEIARRFAPFVRYVYQAHGGTGQARNQGIRLAQGSFFAHLDADDTWHEDKIALQMEAFARDPEIDIVGGLVESFISPELDGGLMKDVYCPPQPLPGFVASVLVVKKEAFFRVGFYVTRRSIGQDLDWHLRAREAGLKEMVVPKVLARRRLHPDNTDLRDRQIGRVRVRVLKDALDRRRRNLKSNENR